MTNKMFFLFVFMMFSTCLSVVIDLNKNTTTRPEVVIIFSRQRSGSTTLSSILATDKCSLFGNEIWIDTNGQPGQDFLNAHEIMGVNRTTVMDNPLRFLTGLNEKLCSSSELPEECGGKCTIVAKLFDLHYKWFLTPDGIRDIISDERIEFVILERDVNEVYTSTKSARRRGDWTTHPGKNRPSKEYYGLPPLKFIEDHNSWYSFIRKSLLENGRVYTEVSFQSLKGCNLFNKVLPKVFYNLGFDLNDIDVKDHYVDNGLEDLVEGCPEFKK